MPINFRDLCFDPERRHVSRNAREIQLTGKTFELLAFLIERRPNAVSKEEIHARLWPATFVSEVTLHSVVSDLRRALRDEASNPHFVRTIHGFGYAFICAADEDKSPPTPRRVRAWLIGDNARLQVLDGENLFGRGVDDVIELPSTTVSRRHARISFDDEAWLEDLGSKNGTFVQDRPVTERVRLADGDRVRLGSLLLTFRVAHPPDRTSTQSTSDLRGAGHPQRRG